MKKLKIAEVTQYVEKNIGTFHQKRISSLDALSLSKVLKRKNPYLFKAKYLQTSEKIVRGLVNAHISSNEETIFGDWLEGLTIFINSKVFGGRKSGIPGIDLEFDDNKTTYIVSIKSGPNWGNDSQIKKMINKFTYEFGQDFCDSNGKIDWKKLVEFNSSSALPSRKKKTNTG